MSTRGNVSYVCDPAEKKVRYARVKIKHVFVFLLVRVVISENPQINRTPVNSLTHNRQMPRRYIYGYTCIYFTE